MHLLTHVRRRIQPKLNHVIVAQRWQHTQKRAHENECQKHHRNPTAIPFFNDFFFSIFRCLSIFEPTIALKSAFGTPICIVECCFVVFDFLFPPYYCFNRHEDIFCFWYWNPRGNFLRIAIIQLQALKLIK